MHIRARRTAHDIYRIVNGAGIDIQILHLIEDIALADARLMCRAVVKHAADGADSCQVGRGNLDADTRVFAFVILPELGVLFGCVVEGVRITQPGEQAVRRAVKQTLLVVVLEVPFVHDVHQFQQLVELLVLLILLA